MHAIKVALTAITLATLPASGSGVAQQAETVDFKEFRAIAEEAYVYAFPMIVAYKVLHDYNVDKSLRRLYRPRSTRSPTRRGFIPPKDTAVSTPNSDTPYSFAQLDLRAEPMVLCMPEIEPRSYYDVQLTDMYTFNYGYMGSRTTGNDAGCYLVAGSDWSGETPKGVKQGVPQRDRFCAGHLPDAAVRARRHAKCREDPGGLQRAAAFCLPRPACTAAAPAVDWPAFAPTAFTTDFPKYLNFLLQFAPASATPQSEQNLGTALSRSASRQGSLSTLEKTFARATSCTRRGNQGGDRKDRRDGGHGWKDDQWLADRRRGRQPCVLQR